MSKKKLEKSTPDPVDELKNILKEGEEIGEVIAEQGRQTTEGGQLLSDLSKTFVKIIDKAPPESLLPNLEVTIEDWRKTVKLGRQIRDRHDRALLTRFSSTFGTATITSSDTVNTIGTKAGLIPFDDQESFIVTRIEFDSILNRTADRVKLQELFLTFGLNEPFNGRMPVSQQYETAYNAMVRPVSSNGIPANTSLIPLREAIETALDQLLDKRPHRTNLSRDDSENRDWRKITAIAQQLRKDDVSNDDVQSWARDWTSLKNKSLSPSKQEMITRVEWQRRFNTATILLLSLLQGLDPKKTRQP